MVLFWVLLQYFIIVENNIDFQSTCKLDYLFILFFFNDINNRSKLSNYEIKKKYIDINYNL